MRAIGGWPSPNYFDKQDIAIEEFFPAEPHRGGGPKKLPRPQ